MKERVIEKVTETLDSIGKVKMQIIINKGLYDSSCISYEDYKTIDSKLNNKLRKLKNSIV